MGEVVIGLTVGVMESGSLDRVRRKRPSHFGEGRGWGRGRVWRGYVGRENGRFRGPLGERGGDTERNWDKRIDGNWEELE